MSDENRPEIWQAIDLLQMQLRAATASLVTVRSLLAGLNIPDPVLAVCPHCGIKARGPRSLEEHVYVSHDGPVPQAWEIAEQIAG